jgi:hypothetical protein
MIPGNTYMLIFTQKHNALVGVRPIAHHITQTPYLVKASPNLYILEHRLKSRQITMYVTQDGNFHNA